MFKYKIIYQLLGFDENTLTYKSPRSSVLKLGSRNSIFESFIELE